MDKSRLTRSRSRSIWNFFGIGVLAVAGVVAGSISMILAAAGTPVIVASVIGSYVIRRYEILNAPPSPIRSARASLFDRLLGMAGEAVAAFLCAVLYPFGYLGAAAASARLRRGERPLILCHGYLTNRSSLWWLGRQLRRAGRHNVLIPNFRPASASVRQFAEQLAKLVALAREHAGATQVDLLGHSMGGVVIRYYIEHLGGAPSVHTAVTIGSPHLGTKTAVLGLFKTAGQFGIHSSFIKECCSSPPVEGVRMISIWSEFDNVVLPPENALLPPPYTNIMVKNVGHMALLFSKQVVAQLRLAFTDSFTA